MKRSAVCLSLAAVLLSGITSFAAEYDLEDNTVSGIEADTYRTVLIVKADDSIADGDIVYVGQADGDDLFSSAVSFGLKTNPQDGLYYLKLGGKADGGSADSKKFYIGMPVTDNDAKCDVSFKEEDGSAAFGWEGIDAGKYSSVLIKINDTVYGCELGTIIAEGSPVNIGLKLTGITEEISEADAYLSVNRIGAELKGAEQ